MYQRAEGVLQVMLPYHSSALQLVAQSAACHQASPGANGTVQC